MARNNASGTRGRPFAPGNPGRPKGAKNKVTLAVEALLENEAEAIGRKCVEMALGGDPVALRLAMERIAPARRGRPVRFELPDAETAADVSKSLAAVLRATATGALTPDEAALVAQVIDRRRAAIELVEIEQRVARLEQAASR